MTEQITLQSSWEIRDWIQKNGFDVVSLESDAPRFFHSKFTPSPGPQMLFKIEHTYLLAKGQPMITVKQNIRAANAEDALYRYLQGPKEHSTGNDEHYLGFVMHLKPGSSDQENISVIRLSPE